eukprot:10325488-Alexandrium_andersonii.AAC.1
MSASLVGSEMCIRDSSPLRGPEPAKVGAHPFPLRVSEALCVAWRLLRPDPVSYTHLTLPTICSV